MELSNEFEVGVPLAEAWEVLTDVERIAPCMPGAELREVEGDEYRGVVKVKVGPISAEYRGAARFLERDDISHRAVLRAEGREARGQGNANATITASLAPSSNGTKVSVSTDLQITGKVAQFGRGVLADVTDKLLGQFVASLEATVLTGETKSTEGVPSSSEGTASRQEAGTTADEGGVSSNGAGVRKVQSQPAEPVDLVGVAGLPVARRALPIVGGALFVVLVFALRRRLRRRKYRH